LVDKARNDLSAAVPKFCLALEEHRRTPDGRVRTSQELLSTFFPHDEKACTDKLFRYLPNEVRGPIIAAWGIRGIKAALRDSDEKIQSVVHDALVAGDVDHTAFEDGLSPETLVRWVPLADLWAFWRGGKLTKQAIHKGLSTAYELYLFDARWFLETIQSKGGSLKGTDVLSDGLTKDELSHWIRRIHETGDGTPKGLVAALGWDKIVAKTPNDVLIGVLDAMVTKVGLVVATPRESTPRLTEGAAKADAAVPPPAANPAAPSPVSGSGQAAPTTPTEKPGADAARAGDKHSADDSWSFPPPSESAPSEQIDVVMDDEVLLTERSSLPLPPAIRPPVEEEETQVKVSPRRSEGPLRGPTSRR
jgi:hypothetical protein